MPTEWLVGQADPTALGLEKHIRVTPEAMRKQALERREEWDEKVKVTQRWEELKAEKTLREASLTDGPVIMAPPSFDTIGQKIGLCLLIDFDDDPATVPQAEIVDFCNGDNYTGYGNNGSIKEYYADVSNGQVDFTHVVTVYIRIPNSLHRKSYYNDTSISAGINARRMINDAVTIMKALPNYETEILPTFANLTTRMVNENIFGVEFPVDFEAVAACSVFYAGGNGGVWSMGLWPHYSMLGEPIELSPGGKRLMNYQITDIGSSLEIATFAHENGHMLCGFPDIYDYDVPQDSSGGAGLFCLMNSGTYFGKNPPQFCAYLKYVAGWGTTVEVVKEDAVNASSSSEVGHPDYNKFYRFQKEDVASEYYLFENRQKAGRDANIPASGVAIWHIDELGNRDNQSLEYNTEHKNYECTLVQADNRWDLQNNVNDGDVYDLYYAGNPAPGYVNAFTSSTSPSAHWWDGKRTQMEVRNFSTNSTLMTFTIAPRPPVMLRTERALPVGWVGTQYSFEMGASGGLTPYSWQLIAGALPTGLDIGSGGLISGLPESVEEAAFTLVVAGDNGMAETNDFTLAILPNPELPLVEDFENNGLIPDAWYQESVLGGEPWVFMTGSPSASPVIAHGGVYNACLSVNTATQAVARLISPMLDFGPDAKAARVSFWHYMNQWIYEQDELRVYYKESADSPWQLLATYLSSVTSWTRREIDLPASGRSVYLAFEGTALYGHGVCIDDVAVWDPTPALGLTDDEVLPLTLIELPYAHQLGAEGGTPPYAFEIISGALPYGMTMDSDGLITGVVSNAQTGEFTVRLTDSESAIAEKTFSLTVALPMVDVVVEGFERSGQMPLGWTQEYVTNSLAWKFTSGSPSGIPGQPKEGMYNASLYTPWEAGTPDKKTMLISPWMDLGQLAGDVYLGFWHCMRRRDSGQDELRVYYKSATNDVWHLLAEWTDNVPEWTRRVILLPDHSSAYRIAFEGNALSGYGVCVDDARIMVASAAPVILTDMTLPDSSRGLEYSVQLVAGGGMAPYSWSVVSNALPAGLSLGSGDGVISGTPTAPGSYEFSVRVTGSDNKATEKRFFMRVLNPLSVPFFEGFEHGGSIPAGWTQEQGSGTAPWVFRYGSPLANPKPPAPYAGSYNACCYASSYKSTKLITPMLNLGSNTPNTKVTFWHCMAPYSGRQDKLNIWYRPNLTSAWVFLTNFTANTSVWTERTVELTNTTSTCYLAFQALTAGGYGVCIDDVGITGDLSPYLSWLSTHFTEQEIADGLITGDEDDPDNDGIPNALEFAMGFDPLVPDTEGLPFGGVTAGYLTLSFRMDKDALDAGVIFEVEACTDLLLQDWSTLDISEYLPRADSNTWYQALFWHNVPVTNAPQRFMRFKVYMP
ncbi:MAG: M6 family metalloprotease domain-containing protein [Kiritimatiellae bacterium]|nr:M6 family metalloprotease domain-containing protein [Kiritimatiellia bacterium]